MQATRNLLRQTVCPQCFHKFAPEDVLWVSEHSDLFGLDNRVPNAQLRFLPSRFNANAQAVDPRGFACSRLACPKCHLEIPRSLIDLEPFFLSILGGPGSGKSYFLAAMTNQLRKVLPLSFQTSFSDADATLNSRLKRQESQLFANSRPDEVQELQQLIEKTQEEGDGYDTITFGNQDVKYLRPFAFTMQIQDKHPNVERRGFGRTICLFDNAGESFLVGKDSAAQPVTRHLAESRMLFFVYDPLQDSRFRSLNEKLSYGIVDKSHMGSQESVFQEAAKRVRTFAGLSTAQKYPRPVIVIVTKCDRWLHFVDPTLFDQYPITSANLKMPDGSTQEVNCFDVGMVDKVSSGIRDLLLQTTPELVTAVEGFSDKVRYIPVSATGNKTAVHHQSGLPVMRPGDVRPFWVETPFLYALAASSLGLVPKLRNSNA